MLAIAQTNLQLYNELTRQQRSVAELIGVRSAYELAMPLFSAQFRASGKPFLAHLIGTASILAWMQQPLSVVTAGLLHAAFEFGDFGDGERGITAARQQRLEAVVGQESGELIATYQRLSRREAMRRLRERRSFEGSSQEQSALIIHLADTVEEYADGGIRYAPGKEQFYRQACDADVALETVAAAKCLGLASYAQGFAEVFEFASHCSPPAEIVARRRGSFSLLPASAGERFQVRWRRFWKRASRKAAGLVGRPHAPPLCSIQRTPA
jgi:hypothetical protein